jgi:hypothetical protein
MYKVVPESEGKIIHIFTRLNSYAQEFMNFVSKQFKIEEHLFYFREISQKQMVENKYSQQMVSIHGRYFYYCKFPRYLKRSKRIILHSFPISYSLFFWVIQKRYLKKTTWSIWGFDLYWYSFCKKNLRNRLFERIRKILIPEVKAVLCPVYKDYLLAGEIYNTRADYYKAMYPIPTDFEFLKNLKDEKPKDNKVLTIQIGNSGTPTNNLIDLLQKLESIKNEQILIYCFLSYGEKDYSEKVIIKGKEIFGNKFRPFTEYLSKEKYAETIYGIDVLIMNNTRQQGLGNILSYLYLGKKVYIRSDSTSFDFFSDNEIKVFDTLELFKNMNTDSIREYSDEIRNKNLKKTRELLDINRFIKEWEPILK